MSKLKYQEMLHTLENVDANLRVVSTSVYEPIEHTPFAVVCADIDGEEKWFIVMKNKRIGRECLSREEAILDIDVNKWMYAVHMIVIITEQIIEERGKNFIEDVLKEEIENGEGR